MLLLILKVYKTFVTNLWLKLYLINYFAFSANSYLKWCVTFVFHLQNCLWQMLLGQFGIRYSYVGMRRFLYNNLLEGSGSLIYRFVYYVKTKVSRSEFNYVFSKTTRSIFLKWHIKLECLKSRIFFQSRIIWSFCVWFKNKETIITVMQFVDQPRR